MNAETSYAVRAETLLRELCAPFPQLADVNARALTRRAQRVVFAPKEVMAPGGRACRELFLIAEGVVRTYYIDERRDVNLRFLAAPNLVLPFRAWITGAPSDEWIEAITTVRGVRIPLSDALHHADADRIFRVVAEQHYLAMEQRLRMLQFTAAKARFAYFREVMDEGVLRAMPAYHVASYLGITPETLSRLKRRP